MINTSVKAINSHHIHSSSSEEPQRQSPQADAGANSTRIHPALNGLPSIRQGRQATRRDATKTSSPEHSLLAETFKAQRQAIYTQPGPSNNPHLTALDKLQERDFEPAPGGLKIPFSPNSLPGGGKRVSLAGTSSRDVHVVPAGIRSELRESIVDKQTLIGTLTQELQEARDQGNPALIAQNERLLEQARADLRSLMEQARVYGQEHRRINS
ncbi:XopO/AvrRps4 family type III secretion system effector [Xanthomonas axonopodis pv. phyllanthi]|uniref:XopO/AvrRps4 family type III secretion system effector n=1 Tax=Xanthomonas axonopodis TaxID=53413 RepID=UPI003557252E